MIEVTNNYLTDEEQARILQFIEEHFPDKKINRRTRNSIQRWGDCVLYSSGVVGMEIPECFKELAERLDAISITINEYMPGQGIPWHTDKGKDPIHIINLVSEANLDFRNKTKIKNFVLPVNSMLRMDGEERIEWEHKVPPVKERRFSIVFRKR